MTCPIENIKKISQDKIIYEDNDHIEREIDLAECNENWVEYVNRTFGNPRQITVKISSGVGWRDGTCNKPFFEFFATERVIFMVKPEKRFWDYIHPRWRHKWKHYAAFHRVYEGLLLAGWRTLDLA